MGNQQPTVSPGPQAEGRRFSSSTFRLLLFSTPEFKERTLNVYENKGREFRSRGVKERGGENQQPTVSPGPEAEGRRLASRLFNRSTSRLRNSRNEP